MTTGIKQSSNVQPVYREEISRAKLETKASCRSISPSLEAPQLAGTHGELVTRDTAV